MTPKLDNKPLTIKTLLKAFWGRIGFTWLLTFLETALIALIPLFIGFAIDGLLAQNNTPLFQLIGVMAALIFVSVIRRAYDTRVYSKIRTEIGEAQAARAPHQAVSTLNARLGMGREMVGFLENDLPIVMASIVQLIFSIIILFSFDHMLAFASASAVIAMLLIYALFHRRFYRLNSQLNQQNEQQVKVLETRKPNTLLNHLTRLRRVEVRLSDTESILYGLIFIVLLGVIIFNLWYATTHLQITTGAIFSIISYSWEFVESAIALPVTLQSWSRLSEITKRINSEK